MDDWKPAYLGQPRPVPNHPDKANHPGRRVTREAHEMRARQPDYGEGMKVSADKLGALRGKGGFSLGRFM